MGRLDGKVALITGGARGQGEAEARLFSAEGATVVITDVLDAQGEAVAREISGTYLHHDVASESRWADVVQEVKSRHGRIDILVNNAGIYRTSQMTETSLEEFRQVIDVNQVGVFLGMKHVGKQMMEQRGGAIVNISSIAGMRGGGNSIAYTASKWAVRGMTKSAAQVLGPYGIRVNSIHPGLIDTPMLHQVPGIDADPEAWQSRIPLGRIAEPVDVARLALFLASDDSGYVSGAEVTVDGGMTA
jgi:3alpha(or 20beta)-hydroxysteroid dehydrogenase